MTKNISQYLFQHNLTYNCNNGTWNKNNGIWDH